MNCPGCGAATAPDQNYCGQCGVRLAGMPPLADHAVPEAGAAPAGAAAPEAAVEPEAAVAPGSAAAACEPRYAGFWRRAAALLLDIVIVLSAYGLLVVFSLFERGTGFGGVLLLPLLDVLGVWLYWSLFESSALQATPGKLALGIRVTDLAGQRISFGRATIRHFGRILSSITLYIGYLMAGFTARRQALHDLVAGTLVMVGPAGAQHAPAPHAPASHAPIANAAASHAPPAATPSRRTLAAVLAACVGVLLVAVLLGTAAVPAWQDYAVRAQVAEGMALAGEARQAITAALVAGAPPLEIDEDSLQLGDPPSSRNVEFVRVTAASVVIRFNRHARRQIAGAFLVMAPARNGARDIVWVCGRHAPPAGWRLLVPAAARYTTIQNRYLPADCRG